MGIESPAADDITSGRRERHGTGPSEKRTGKEDGGADPLADLFRNAVLDLAAGVEADGLGLDPFDVDIQALKAFEHHPDIEDIGEVVEEHRLVGEQAGGEHGQCRVFIAHGLQLAGDGIPAEDPEARFHEAHDVTGSGCTRKQGCVILRGLKWSIPDFVKDKVGRPTWRSGA